MKLLWIRLKKNTKINNKMSKLPKPKSKHKEGSATKDEQIELETRLKKKLKKSMARQRKFEKGKRWIRRDDRTLVLEK